MAVVTTTRERRGGGRRSSTTLVVVVTVVVVIREEEDREGERSKKEGGWDESRRPGGRRRLTDRQSRGERARLRGIPGRARAVPLEARRFQSFARDDEPQTTRTQNSVVFEGSVGKGGHITRPRISPRGGPSRVYHVAFRLSAVERKRVLLHPLWNTHTRARTHTHIHRHRHAHARTRTHVHTRARVCQNVNDVSGKHDKRCTRERCRIVRGSACLIDD